MLEKNKIEMKAGAAESMMFELKDGAAAEVVKFIPFEEKEQMALEWAAGVLQTDDELGICYTGYTDDVFETYLFTKYYTSIAVEGEDPVKVFDYMIYTGTYGVMREYAIKDLWLVANMKDSMVEAVKIRFEKEKSLEQLVKGLLNTDPDTNNAETRELIEKLIDMKGALLEKEENEKVLAFGKKKPAVKTGGVVMNLGKKDEGK